MLGHAGNDADKVTWAEHLRRRSRAFILNVNLYVSALNDQKAVRIFFSFDKYVRSLTEINKR